MKKTNKRSFFRDLDHQWVRLQDFQNSNVEDWLSRSKMALKNAANSKPQAWVLDLDSTLFCVSHRMRHVFINFLREHPKPETWWWKLLEDLHPEEHRYGVRTTFRAILKKQDIHMASARAAHLWELFQEHWARAFFSDRFIAYDQAYPGAVDFVNELYDMGYHIVYLTGRDRPRTMAGTYNALKSNRFPMGNRAQLLIKPEARISDVDYKTQVSETLAAQFDVFALMDNEPENLVMFAQRFPKSEIIFFHSIMSPRIPKQEFKNHLNGRKAWKMESFEL